MVPTHPCTVQVAGGAECRSVSGGKPVCGSDTRDYTHERTIYSRYLHLHVSRGAPLPCQSAVNRSDSCKKQQNICRNLRYLLYLRFNIRMTTVTRIWLGQRGTQIQDMAQYKIVVPNFMDKMRNLNPGESLETEVFKPFSDLNMRFLIYPNGSTEDTAGNISVLIKNESEEDVVMDVELEIADMKKRMREQRFGRKPRGLHKFFAHDNRKLRDKVKHSDDMKVDAYLAIFCKLKIISRIAIEDDVKKLSRDLRELRMVVTRIKTGLEGARISSGETEKLDTLTADYLNSIEDLIQSNLSTHDNTTVPVHPQDEE